MNNPVLWSIFHDAIGDISSRKLFTILKKYDLEWLFEASEKEIQETVEEVSADKLKHFIALRTPETIKKRARFLENHQIRLLSMEDEEYPNALKEIHNPPAVLYAIGQPLSSRLHLAMVGSRKATAYGKMNAFELAEALSERDITIVSGLAYGIDGQAHRGALCHQGGTVAVLGCGLNVVYPRTHQKLYHEILKHSAGTILSEYPLYSGPKGYRFPQRNRIIAGLSEGLIVIEAAETSGALITANLALDEGRDVFAVPGSIRSRQSRGCHNLIKDGAYLVTGVDDILQEYGQLSLFEPFKEIKTGIELTAKEMLVLNEIQETPISLEEILVNVSLPVYEIMSILSYLEINDFIQEIVGKQYIRK